jgi:hypothetical protein
VVLPLNLLAVEFTVNRVAALVVAVRTIAVGGLLWLAGCGGSASTEPITDPNAEQQKQLQELQEQRKDEWGRPR